MKTFLRRSDPAYQEHLASCLNLQGPLGLIETAEPLSEAVQREWPGFHRGISLDFLGFTATTLFDPGGMIAKHCHFDKIERLVAEVGSLNKHGIMLRMRILLIYPYSAAGQIRIQAENSTRRASIERPNYKRGAEFIEQLTNETFFASSLFSTSQRTLKVIYELLPQLGEVHPRLQPPNRFSLRFSIFNPIICGLRINTRFFFDVYSYAKHKTQHSICSGDTQPVIEVERENGLPYESFCDHFSYLWGHDATLDAEDAIDISVDAPRLKGPQDILFTNKTRRLINKSTQDLSYLEAQQLSEKARRILKTHCPPVRPSSAVDVAFLGCAWRAFGNAPAAPNKDAQELFELWRRNFGVGDLRTSTVPRIDIKLVSAAAGKNLGGILYDALREATIGIIVLSAEQAVQQDQRDLQRFDCTPNVYHELGFLMAHVPKERAFVFRDRRVRVPTNLGDLIWIDYDEGKINLGMMNLIEGLRDAGILGVEDAAKVAKSHVNQLVRFLEQRILTPDDIDWAKTFLQTHFELDSNLNESSGGFLG